MWVFVIRAMRILLGVRTVTNAVLRPVLVFGLLSEVFMKLVTFGDFQQRMSLRAFRHGMMSTVVQTSLECVLIELTRA